MENVIYFKTKAGLNKQRMDLLEDGFQVNEGVVNVGGGETNGAYVYDTDGNRKSTLVLDEVEYQNAPFIQRGE